MMVFLALLDLPRCEYLLDFRKVVVVVIFVFTFSFVVTPSTATVAGDIFFLQINKDTTFSRQQQHQLHSS